MMWRLVFVLAISTLTACASSGRGIPAPVESRNEADNVRETVITAPVVAPSGATISTPIQRGEIRPNTQPSSPTRPPVTVAPIEPERPTTASSTLLAGVDAAIAQGDLERAAALCERALRITPRDALLWYRLASVRAQQGRSSEAEGFAQRALSFSIGDAALTRQINTLLESL